jgi:methyl-accepting chemotaxis protein
MPTLHKGERTNYGSNERLCTMSAWFKGLRGKLLVSAFLPIIAFAILTGLAVSTMNSLGGFLTDAYTKIIPNTEALGQITTERASIGYFMWAAMGVKDPSQNKDFIEKAQQAFERFKTAQSEYEASTSTEEEIKNYAEVKSQKARFYELTSQMIHLLEVNTPESDEKVLGFLNGGEWHKLSIGIRKAAQANTKIYKEFAKAQNEIQMAERKFSTQLLLLTSVVAGLFLFGVLMWIAFKVSNSIRNIAEQLTGAGDQVSGAITQLTSAGQILSEASTESAASLEETVASLEELSSMVRLNSDNAAQAATLSQSSKSSAEHGQEEMKNLIGSMHEISKSSRQIEEIISVIDDIAFQTNLLALNASVEAARAGEQGKGFAVVAEAVRTLAQRSASAAKDIGSLIRDSSDKVARGSTTADRSGEVLNTIVNSVKKVSDLNSEISTASSEQTNGIQQISKAMNQLDQSAQSNAASSEEIAASAEEISAQTFQMKKLVSDLNFLILGDNPAPEKMRAKDPKPAQVLQFRRPAQTAQKTSSGVQTFGKVGSTKGF